MQPPFMEHEDPPVAPDASGEAPRHGYQGDRGAAAPPPALPAGLCIALSREAGARGVAIGRRVGQKLGWQVFDQELLEYMAQDAVVRQGVLDNLTPAATVMGRGAAASAGRAEPQPASGHSEPGAVVLALGAQGEAVLVGRGSGFILPRASTLHVRLVAPLQERIAYMSQWLRLPVEEATEWCGCATRGAASSCGRISTATTATCIRMTCC